MATKNISHWQLTFDDENICWLGFAKHRATTNTFDVAILHELSQVLTDIANNDRLQGLVIFSAQKKGFIAGADIEQFKHLDDRQTLLDFLALGQHVFNQLENLTIPTCAMIDGFCLGGGTELVLACNYRILEESAQSYLSLPEVNLGIYPGWGGTVRLPKLIGPIAAFDMILTGRKVSGKSAKRMGLVDDVVPRRQLANAARQMILQRPAKQQPAWWLRILNKAPWRILLAHIVRRQTAAKVSREHYPSPYAVIDNFETYGPYYHDAYLIEREALANMLMRNDTSRNLIRIFFLRERMRHLAKNTTFKAKHVHVIGAGTMGGDIAAWCALQGLTVTLQDRNLQAITPAFARAYKLFSKKLKTDLLTQRAFDRLIPDVNGDGIAKADVIIEAVFENLAVKQQILVSVLQQAKPDAIIATNTSSIPLDEINQALSDRERLIGIHFFNPVAKMPLVEVVVGRHTATSVVDAAFAFVQQIDRLPLPVKSSPGFLVNRILMPYLMECFYLLKEGYQAEAIDAAAEKFGMPMGPVELADTIGLDICLSVATNLTQHFGGEVPKELADMVAQGLLGRKSGQGFYLYKRGKAVKRKVISDHACADIIDRLLLCMLNEAAACLQEGVVSDADMLDAGMIFGTGFAPFRGGPMHYITTVGKEVLQAKSDALLSQHGPRYAVNRVLLALL